jgi:Methyltransferase domain
MLSKYSVLSDLLWKKVNDMYITPVLKGIATLIPGVKNFVVKRTGGTDSARYCYAVWLRCLLMAYENGLSVQPKIVAEIGPGDSLGIGLAALISGTEKYYAFDIFKYANYERNIVVFDELVKLFEKKENIPSEIEFPNLKPYLKSYDFPDHILNEYRLTECLEQERIEKIRRNLKTIDDDKETNIQYFVPWYNTEIIEEMSVDMVFSQAALEHVDDLEDAYKKQYCWLKPNGFVSHQIDFKSHGITKEWNGHWKYDNFTWKIIQGSRPYSLNRQPHSMHIELLKKNNFEILCDIKTENLEGICREHLATEFCSISNEDLICSGSFIQAIKVVPNTC